jgi:hypothetical protein
VPALDYNRSVAKPIKVIEKIDDCLLQLEIRPYRRGCGRAFDAELKFVDNLWGRLKNGLASLDLRFDCSEIELPYDLH